MCADSASVRYRQHFHSAVQVRGQYEDRVSFKTANEDGSELEGPDKIKDAVSHLLRNALLLSLCLLSFCLLALILLSLHWSTCSLLLFMFCS